jgi:hypothetical protein
MARGWESKAVEDQIGEAEAKRDVRRQRTLSPAETEHLQRKEALLLERARIVREMERAYMRRHLVTLDEDLPISMLKLRSWKSRISETVRLPACRKTARAVLIPLRNRKAHRGTARRRRSEQGRFPVEGVDGGSISTPAVQIDNRRVAFGLQASWQYHPESRIISPQVPR